MEVSAKESRKTQSLKFDLIFDLSLLTLCALVLSEGLLIVLLRFEFPREFVDVAESVLKPVHKTFLQSASFKTWKNKANELESPERLATLKDAFERFKNIDGIGKGWAEIDILGIRLLNKNEDPRPQEEWKAIKERFLLVIPTPVEYRYLVTLDDPKAAYSIEYRWSLASFHRSLTHFKYRAFLLTLLIEGLLVWLGYLLLFRRNVLIPIHNLSLVAKEFLKENWSARCEIERHDELGNVASALNEMAQNIQEKEGKLVQTIESLKRANEEIEAAQNEQLQIEKLASIGRLAAGVAHEVGNPLGAILGYVDILKRALQKKMGAKEDAELCDRIEAETHRISRIVRALLQQARPPKDRIKSVLVRDVAIRSVQLAQIPPEIEVVYEFEDNDAEVSAEEDQLVQVMLNLLVNAKHAIETKKEKGLIKIRCHSRKLPFFKTSSLAVGGGSSEAIELDTSVVRALKPEVYWVMSVEDNGIGIAEEDQKKLFEPFFSTKPVGKGTGLGLYVTKSIIESFRGAIVVRSAKNFGTSFSLFLPKAKI